MCWFQRRSSRSLARVGGLVGVVLFIYVIAKIIADRRSADALNNARPNLTATAVNKRLSTARTVKALVRTRWGTPLQGGLTFESLVKARRFEAAARGINLDDWKQRAYLAVARGGPTPDLIRAKEYPPTRRLSWLALRTLEHLYGKALIPPTFLGGHLEDDASVLDLVVLRHLQRGRSRRSARLLERIGRRWPQADDVMRTRERIAYAWAISGDFDRALTRAAALSVETDDAAISARMTRLAEGARRRSIEDSHSSFSRNRVARVKRVRSARTVLDKAMEKSPVPTARYPGVSALALERLGRQVGYIRLDPRAVAHALKSGHVAHVGVLSNQNVIVTSILAVEHHSGTALLSTGDLIAWEDLQSLSIWGDRVLISRRRRLSVETVDQNPAVVSPALDADGMEVRSGAALAAARAEVDAHPDDALAAFLYWRLLLQARMTLTGHPTHQEFAAACTARHPGARWPELMVTTWAEHTPEDVAHNLYVLGSPPHFKMDATIAVAQARLGGLGDWAQISRAQIADPTALDPLEAGIEWALLASRGPDVDAHLGTIEQLHPYAEQLPYWRAMREIAWRGGRDAYPVLSSSHLEGEPVATVGLALHTGSPAYLTEATQHLRASHPAHHALRLSEALIATHEGDVVAAVDAATKAASGHGWLPALSDLVCDVVAHQATEHHFGALARILANASSDGTPALGMIASAALKANAPDLALTVSRADMGSGAWDGAVRHAGVVLTLSRVGAADLAEAQAALTSVAQSSDPAVHRAISCAIALETDADVAWDMVSELAADRCSFATHLLIAAIATARSDAELADIHLARAANPRIAEDGWQLAGLIGLVPWAERAIQRIDAQLAPVATVGLYGEGATVTTMPALPAPARTGWPLSALDRLAVEGDPGLMAAAAMHRWPAPRQLHIEDGTRGAAAYALTAALAGNPDQLEALFSESRHPGIGLAAYAAARAGAAVPWSVKSVAARLPSLQRFERNGGRA